MVYIGNTAGNRFVTSTPASVYSGDGSTTVFTLEHSVGSDEDILVSVDGVVQEPSVAYAVSNGTTLTFTGAPSNNAGNNIFVYYLHRTVASVNHSEFTPLKATTGTFSGNVSVGGNLDVTGSLDMSDANLTNVGSIQLDSISGDADTDTNITFSGSDVITFTTGGSTAFTANANQSVTFSGSVTGITDLTMSGNLTVDTNTLFVDSANNRVGIGTASSLVRDLNINGTAANSKAFVRFSHDGLASTGLDVGYSSAGYASIYNAENTAMVFSTNASEAMRIDASGNLLVGGTTFSQNSAEKLSVFGRTGIEASAGVVLGLDRQTSDGEILQFRKDNGTVGSIGADTGDLTIGNGVIGLRFRDAGNDILPFNMSTGVDRDNAIDLGDASSRFQDLFLSGGVYLGGTGSANKLDDYEEGTFTLNLGGATFSNQNSTAYYTKIGRQVFFNFYSGGINISSASGQANFTGLPFTASNGTEQYGIFLYVHGNAITGSKGGYIIKNGTKGIWVVDDSVADSTFVNGNPKYLMISGHYQTDS